MKAFWICLFKYSHCHHMNAYSFRCFPNSYQYAFIYMNMCMHCLNRAWIITYTWSWNLTFSLLRCLNHALLSIYLVKLHYWRRGRWGIHFFPGKSEMSFRYPSGTLSKILSSWSSRERTTEYKCLGNRKVEFLTTLVPITVGLSYIRLGNKSCPPKGLGTHKEDSWVGKGNSLLQRVKCILKNNFSLSSKMQ